MFIPKKYLRIRDMGQKLMRYRESPRQREERRKNYKRVKEIYENTYFIVNAGGFALGAPIGRGKSAGSLAYLMRIMAAKELKVPIYLLPQSFGPFDYKPGHNFLVKHLMKKYMDYPRLIFAREQEGYECLLPYRKSGLLKEKDIVITNVQIDKQNIFKDGKGEIKTLNIKGCLLYTSIYLKEAKKLGRITIAHSHNTSSGRGFKAMLKTILQYPIRFRTDYMFACSKAVSYTHLTI